MCDVMYGMVLSWIRFWLQIWNKLEVGPSLGSSSIEHNFSKL